MASQITSEDIASFVKQNYLRILIRGGISFAAVILLIVLYYAFAPRKESYRVDVQVTLESTGKNKLHYPNGRSFSAEDLVSAPVLNRVWRERGLESTVKFEDFCKWFSLIGFERDRVKLDAEYQSKMTKRNITVAELTSLQKEYETKISSLDSNLFSISMRPDVALNSTEAVEILTAVPRAWYNEYSIVNAPQIPAIMRPEVIRVYWNDLKTHGERSLEMIDTMRRFLQELNATCSYVRTKVLAGRNAIIDGQDLGVHEAHLNIYAAEIIRLKNMLLKDGNLMDLKGYVDCRIDDIECDELLAKDSIEAVQKTLDVLNEKTFSVPAAEAAGGASPASVAMQTDAGFFQDFAALIRKDAKQESVRKYVDELTEARKTLAEINSRRLYYAQIERYIAAAKAASKSGSVGASTQAVVDKIVSSILDDGNKIIAFRDRALQLYRTSDQFYALPGVAAYGKTFTFSVARFAFGLFALWALYNLISLITLWNKR